MDGLQLADAVLTLSPQLAVIFMSEVLKLWWGQQIADQMRREREP